jgi:regulator of PEP synthase PpsR (kinase-PPPase family)
MKRSVFFVSDRTGITAETLGNTLLTQFEAARFKKISLPFIDTPEKADRVVSRINRTAEEDGLRPLVFSTMVEPGLREIIGNSNGLLMDFFDTFISPIEAEIGVRSSYAVGRSHGIGAYADYKARIDAVNFALSHDDGVATRSYGFADLILIGVSRSGKTPTCLYLALQYGLLVANYPLTEEDLASTRLPASLESHKGKLFGLTIDAERLHQIRTERRPNSRYASLAQCRRELQWVEGLYGREKIPFINTSSFSIEEIATTVLHETGLKQRLLG